MSENACMLMPTTDLVGQKVEKHNRYFRLLFGDFENFEKASSTLFGYSHVKFCFSRRQKILPV
jgi:hypothetical protein